MTRRMTINGKTYQLRDCSYDSFVRVRGPGVFTITLPEGVTLNSADLRDHLIREIENQKKRDRAAREMIQQRVENGTVGIGAQA